MKKIFNISFISLLLSSSAFAADNSLVNEALAKTSPKVNTSATTTSNVQSWMNTDVGSAWSQGYKGQGTTIIDVDDFSSTNKFSGNFNGTSKNQRHGEWTREEISLIAPSAKITSIDFNTSNSAVPLSKTGLNVINASYGLFAKSGYSASQINFGTLQNSVINNAKNGTAIISKAAGNYAVAVNGSYNGNTDYLNLALKGAPTAIYVGALNTNGSTTNKATLASYSNYAGSDTTIQKQFLVVGVEGSKTGLYGTSFAAPIISGYAAILGSKFTTATEI